VAAAQIHTPGRVARKLMDRRPVRLLREQPGQRDMETLPRESAQRSRGLEEEGTFGPVKTTRRPRTSRLGGEEDALQRSSAGRLR
jgi:hypothetical protein